MMHPLGGGGYQPALSAGYSSMETEQQSPTEQAGSPGLVSAGATGGDPSNGGAPGTDGTASGQNGAGGAGHYTDINQILDQILNITDQSLDEAQVRLCTS